MAGYYSRPAQLARQMRQLLFPRRCPCCRRVLGTLPLCEVCTPRLEELRRGPYLGALDGAAAPYRYEGVVRSAILRAKYEGESWTAVELGVEMTARLFGAEVEMHCAEPVPGLVPGAAIGYDCIVPVPATTRE
jgi:predicted amidophosphoribosyltransferase